MKDRDPRRTRRSSAGTRQVGRGGSAAGTLRRAASGVPGRNAGADAATRQPKADFVTYLTESRDIGVSVVLVLPLLLAYEIAVAVLQPTARNGAELFVARLLAQLDPLILTVLRRGTAVVLIAVALAWLLHHPPRVARLRWLLAEAALLALLLGPLLGLLVGGLGLSLSAGPESASGPVWQPFLLSVGAGVWEELVFRLGLLGGLTILLVRVLSLPRPASFAIALIVSSLVFALYHHVGHHGEPVTAGRFAFRALAGTIIGLLFASRGLAVVVYMHVFYDVLCDLRSLSD